jgi:hypothetical protein
MENMKYHLYFHDDFDGVASAAVMLNFLKGRGDNIVSFTPVNYSPLKKKWASFKFKQPFIILDFLYHPRASWWFDHHLTTFVSKKWQRKFINSDTHHFNPRAESSCGMLFSFLKRKYGYNPPAFIKNLAKWADIIDSASYASARQAVEVTKENQPVGLALFLDEARSKWHRKIIKQLAMKPLSQIVKRPHIQKWLERRRRKTEEVKRVFKNKAVLKGKTLIVDNVRTKLVAPRFLGYFLYPKISYVIGLESVSGGYHLGVGRNPWLKTRRKANIGRLLKKYGGGGHKTVGGVERKSKSEILKIAGEVIEYLNKHG